MPDPEQNGHLRFGIFEADRSTGELRRKGVRIKLNAQPFQILCMLLDRPGELLTREEIVRELWPDGTFVDFEHGVNSAVNRLREALGDEPANPRYIETLARRGYRFIAPVERNGRQQAPPPQPQPGEPSSAPLAVKLQDSIPCGRILATPDELPKMSRNVVQALFLLFQLMYLAFYVGALANLAEIHDLLSPLPWPTLVFCAMIATAAILIPVRAFILTAVVFHAPAAQQNFLRLWPFLLALDMLWSLSPFLLLHHINAGLALSFTVLLVYSPFAQRSLALMGAGSTPDAQ